MNHPEPSTTLPHDLFSYLPRYRVIVCNKCHYAVPRKAVSRHLKEIHRLVSSARQPCIDWADGLDLCEPENVVPPGHAEFPVAELPVYMGLRCTWPGCGHVCLTEKRMRHHWNAAHAASVAAPVHPEAERLGCSAVPVQVQTFFRGNMLRYFSAPVESSGSTGSQSVERVEHPTLVWRFVDISWRQRQGDWPPSSAFKASRMLGASAPDIRTFGLDPTVVDLLHYYQKWTCRTIATDGDDGLFWRNTVPLIARSQPYLMLAVLSITSLHLAYLLPERRRELTMQANEYHGQAMPLFREAIANPNSENCHAVLLFSHFLILNTFTSEQQDDNLLLVTGDGDEVVPPWLYFIRNSCSMLCGVWDDVAAGPCQDLADRWEAPFKINEMRKKLVSESLLAAVPVSDSPEAWPHDVHEVYHEAAAELALAFACSDSSPLFFTTWDALRLWPMRISDEFMRLLKDQHPAGLILLAHYTLILRRIESKWYFQGRTRKLLNTVRQNLDPRWHSYIPQDIEI